MKERLKTLKDNEQKLKTAWLQIKSLREKLEFRIYNGEFLIKEEISDYKLKGYGIRKVNKNG
ncbi:MAG: hypothetical protein HC836_45120 [Richelia sp. RM2_1_2]|nr:hypothetical protein [Richelia sp. RM2_1_2]